MKRPENPYPGVRITSLDSRQLEVYCDYLDADLEWVKWEQRRLLKLQLWIGIAFIIVGLLIAQM